MKAVSEKTKIREGRGKGEGSKYKPWIKAREVASKGTASTFADYKHGREIQLLSQGEVYYYYLLRWDDNVKDIREQYPLDLNLTVQIAKELDYDHPQYKGQNIIMTTDFLVTLNDGTHVAYSIKDSKTALSNDLSASISNKIEQAYWERKGVAFKTKYKKDVDVIKVRNIMDVTRFYYICDVQTKEDLIRHFIANKYLEVDMSSNYICYKELLPLLEGSDKYEELK